MEMRDLLNIVNGVMNEKVEHISSGTKKEVVCLVNPGKIEFMAHITNWYAGSRCLIDDRGNLFVCDKYDAYHYQMARQLGVEFDTAVAFYGYGDYVGFDMDPFCKNQIFRQDVERKKAVLRSNKHVLHIWGHDVLIKHVNAD